MTTVIRGGQIFIGTGAKAIPNGVLAVEDGKITYAGPVAGFAQPRGDMEIIDATGKTVLPGLIDLHVHLIYSYRRPVEHHLERALGVSMMAALANCERALLSGITAVRDCGAGHHGIFALRDSINSGEVKGPRVFAAGKAICITVGSNWEVVGREADGPDECRKAAREQLRPPGPVFANPEGADHLKVMATDHGYHRTRVQMTVEEMAAVAEEAHKRDRRVTAHVGGAAGALACVRAGVDCIEHGNVLDEESAEAMRKAGSWYVPTLVTYWEPAEMGTAAGFSEHEVGFCRFFAQSHRRSLEMALQAGITIGAGSDSGSHVRLIGKTLLHELDLLVDHGMTPGSALRSATSVAAEILGHKSDIGTLEQGKLADVLVVDGDPLSRIEDIRNTWLVMRDGRVEVDNRPFRMA